MFTTPTKRTHGQCTCWGQGRAGHEPDCPALYPLQPQPGDLTESKGEVPTIPLLLAENARLRHTLDVLRLGHQLNGEARMRAILDFAEELMPMSAEERERILRRIIDQYN